MVVLSAAICTKNGRALLSRQFVEMGRSRTEGLLAAFPKLISGAGAEKDGAAATTTGGAASKQHTFVETDNVRYVYLPLEALYLLLITNKNSNIIEDLDTLRLLSRLVPEQVGVGVPINEETVSIRAFELIFALDEVIAAGGYREDVTLHNIRTNLEMESHEEKLAQMIKASKMAEAKEAAKRRAQEIRERARDDDRISNNTNRMGGFGSSSSPGGGGSGGGGGGYDNGNSYDGGSSSSSSSSSGASSSAAAASAAAAASTSKKPTAGGMKLASKKAPGALGLGGAASGAFASVIAEEGIKDRDLVDENSGAGGAAAAVQAARAAAEAASADQATVVIEEHVAARIGREGGCLGYEVKGSLSLTVQDENAAKLKVNIRRGDDRAFAYQSHPNVNKPALGQPNGEGSIGLKQSDRPFPTGAPVGVLRWRCAAKDDDSSQLPLMITCWPEEGAGGVYTVNVEYTLQREDVTLTDVIVSVPLGATEENPKVAHCDGVYKHNTRENLLAWRVESVSSENSTGALEFTIKGGRGLNADSFFPVRVTFGSTDTLCPIAVTDVVGVDDGKTLRNSITKGLVVDEYIVE